jgi:hypothetical protein
MSAMNGSPDLPLDISDSRLGSLQEAQLATLVEVDD